MKRFTYTRVVWADARERTATMPLPAEHKSTPTQTNIILFLSDQQRYDSLGCNGQSLPVTPELDRFAQEYATNYKRAYTVQPVCGPARSCLQTGRYASETGCFRNNIALAEDMPTLAKELSEETYQVAYCGKWHLGIDNDLASMADEGCPPTERKRRGGFDEYWMAVDLLEMTSHGYGGYVYDRDNNRVDFAHERATAITDFALDFIKERDRNRPFFLMISTLEPHHQNDRNNFEAPLGYREKFLAYAQPADLEKGEGDWERFLPDYLGCCHAVDENFGRVLACLREEGLFEESMVIYTSDHGCHFRTKLAECTPGGYDDYKRNSFESACHIPLLIKGPGIKAGAEEQRLVSLLDLPTTILAAASCAQAPSMRGRDLAAFAAETSAAENDTDKPGMAETATEENSEILAEQGIYIEISESYVGRVLVTPRWKYVVYDPDADPWNDCRGELYRERYLFDLEKDPTEKRNLIADPAYAGLRLALRAALVARAAEIGEEVRLA